MKEISKLLEIINKYKDYDYFEFEVKIKMNDGSYGNWEDDENILKEEFKRFDECVEIFENDLKENKLNYDKELIEVGCIFKVCI
jgi:hypothetical protein